MKFLLLLLSVLWIKAAFAKPFEVLMTQESLQTAPLQTPEDKFRLEFFKKLFEAKTEVLKKIAPPSKQHAIPKVFHFIWLGEKPLPKGVEEKMLTWIRKHPDWTFKFWSDEVQQAPFKQMIWQDVSSFSFNKLSREYFACEHFEEKVKLLSYEILAQEGGVYVDSETAALKNFDSLNEEFDFYCGLMPLRASILSSSVIASPHLIGACPKHPVLEETMKWIHERWDFLEQSFPGKSSIAIAARIMHRTIWALSAGIDKGIDQEGYNDIVFPAHKFSALKKDEESFAAHENELRHLAPSSAFETKVDQKLQEIIREENETIVMILIAALLSFLGVFSLFIYMMRKDRQKSGNMQ